MKKESSSTESYEKYGSKGVKPTWVPSIPKRTIEIDPDNIIFRFKDIVSEKDRDDLRKEYKVTEFKTCSCGDKNLELWGLETNIFIAEDAVSSLKRNRSEGNLNCYFPFPKAENFERSEDNFSEDVCISGRDDTKVNIAVLDTGIDLRYFDDAPFLYNTSGLGDCGGYGGWNFSGVGSSNVFDDHGHGTYVTKIITETLKAKGIGYRILPLKVLDSEGKGSFWNLLCALSYLQKIQKEGANIHLVNASLGGTMGEDYFQKSDLFNTIVQELKNDMLIVTSAGNEGVDTDLGNLRHYPSSYTAENILAVGGHYKEVDGNLKVHLQSNYGKQSIDLAAPFEITVAGLPLAILEGTSFSTAYVTALAAAEFGKYEVHKPTPQEVKTRILDLTKKEPELEDDKIAVKRAIGSGLSRGV